MRGGFSRPSLLLGETMTKEDIQDIRNILKVFEQARFNDIDLQTQMSNVALLSKFSAAVKSVEDKMNEKEKKSK